MTDEMRLLTDSELDEVAGGFSLAINPVGGAAVFQPVPQGFVAGNIALTPVTAGHPASFVITG